MLIEYDLAVIRFPRAKFSVFFLHIISATSQTKLQPFKIQSFTLDAIFYSLLVHTNH